MKSRYLMTIFAVILLMYSGWRSVDYMLSMLSGVNATVAYLVAFTFLFSSEIGLLIWLHYAAPNATTGQQEATANIMVAVNFVGSMILGLADILKHNTLYQIDLPWLEPILLLAPWLLIASNVLGHIIYHRGDADEMLAKASRELAYQERKLHVSAKLAAIEELKANEEALARQLSPHYAKDIQDRVTGETMARLGRQVGKLRAAEERASAPALPGRNGHSDEPLIGLVEDGNGHSPKGR